MREKPDGISSGSDATVPDIEKATQNGILVRRSGATKWDQFAVRSLLGLRLSLSQT